MPCRSSRARPIALAALIALPPLALAAQTAVPGTASSGATPAARERFTVEKYLDLERVGAPQISPDGQRIVYTRGFVNRTTDRWESALWLVGADGSRHHFLVKGTQRRLVPRRDAAGLRGRGRAVGPQIHVRWMDAGGATSQITRVGEPVGDLQWSPDGRQLAFSTFVPAPATGRSTFPPRRRARPGRRRPRHVTTLHYRQDRKGFDRPGSTHLFVVPADGGTPRQLTRGPGHVGARFDGQAGSVGYDWTPDGRTIVVEGVLDTTADANYRNSNLYAVDVATARCAC
jgi:Tol biopolymer transport system component